MSWNASGRQPNSSTCTNSRYSGVSKNTSSMPGSQSVKPLLHKTNAQHSGVGKGLDFKVIRCNEFDQRPLGNHHFHLPQKHLLTRIHDVQIGLQSG